MSIQVRMTSYDAYETYLNSIIFDHLGNSKLPHVNRGSFILAENAKVNSEEFLVETSKWLEKTLNLNILYVGLENYTETSLTFFCSVKTSYFLVTFCNGHLTYDVFAENFCQGMQIINALDERYKAGTKSVGGNIKFAFWQHDVEENASVIIDRKICPSFDEIKENYPPKLGKQIMDIIGLKEPYQHGKIILLHGKSGGGKTTLIRTIARSWNEMYGIIPEVIIDPEQLYDTPKYLTTLLINGTDQIYSKTQPAFRLIIAEDCAQLFSSDCRNQTGFSRLLNTVDGLLGQGQKLIFIFTANEQIETIDPAILRPGRCLKNLEIPLWGRSAATNWLKSKQVTGIPELNSEVSLAEMYAILNRTVYEKQKTHSFGFEK